MVKNFLDMLIVNTFWKHRAGDSLQGSHQVWFRYTLINKDWKLHLKQLYFMLCEYVNMLHLQMVWLFYGANICTIFNP